MSRCVIVGGAKIENYAVVKQYISDKDFFIFCDSGLSHQSHLGRTPNLIVGDFDSFKMPDESTETIVLPREKDDTDTFFAVKEAVSRGFSEFLFIGVCGGRLDHTLGNLSILLYLNKNGCRGTIVDDYSEIELVGKDEKEIACTFPYFSVLNITGKASGITIKNAKFPLRNATISCDYQYGISNEPLPDKSASVSVSEGCALLIKVRNE